MGAFDHPHRRLNPLSGTWVLVSAGRTRRPWQGQRETGLRETRPRYEPSCYLCPGNERASGDRNPDYEQTFVFINDFAALQPDTPAQESAAHPLLRAHTQPGTCRVLCFDPRHDLTLAEMERDEVHRVVDLWADQIAELSPRFPWVQVFENRGETMGASNPHPHGQLWATATVPHEPAVEDERQREYHRDRGGPMLVEYANLESKEQQRIVVDNDEWVALVPFWATWPFETLVLPRRHVPRLTDLDDAERATLAALLQELLIRYDNLFEHPFPYSMGWHGAPGAQGDDVHWQLHAHFYPPLLRSATVRKFMVGYEMLADVQRDLSPEESAQRLREVPDLHYRHRVEP